MRKYKTGDLTEVMAIANAAWHPITQMTREALGNKIADRLHPGGDDVYKGEQIKKQLASGEWDILICEHNGKIVGFVTFSIAGETGKIGNNAAKTGTGLKGIGQTMYRTVFEFFRAHGVKTVSVTTGLDWAHAPARRAYERAGFKHRLESTTYYMDLEEEFK